MKDLFCQYVKVLEAEGETDHEVCLLTEQNWKTEQADIRLYGEAVQKSIWRKSRRRYRKRFKSQICRSSKSICRRKGKRSCLCMVQGSGTVKSKRNTSSFENIWNAKKSTRSNGRLWEIVGTAMPKQTRTPHLCE